MKEEKDARVSVCLIFRFSGEGGEVVGRRMR